MARSIIIIINRGVDLVQNTGAMIIWWVRMQFTIPEAVTVNLLGAHRRRTVRTIRSTEYRGLLAISLRNEVKNK